MFLDTNLLILLVVGRTHPSYVAKHKNLAADEGDYHLLASFLTEHYDEIVVTPHVLAESSSLLRQDKDPRRSEIQRVFRAFLEEFIERAVSAQQAGTNHHFIRLGLTDSAINEVLRADKDIHLLTSDLDLYLACSSEGFNVTNFNHLREANRLA